MKSLSASSVVIRDARVAHASNDGMQILGHFLLSQVGADRVAFFTKWLKEPQDDSLTSSSYFIEKIGDVVYVDHLELEDVVLFETTRKNMIDIINHWHGWCASDAHSACKVGGYDVSIERSENGESFEFHTHGTH